MEEAGRCFLHLSRTYPENHGYFCSFITGLDFGLPSPCGCYLGPYLQWDVTFCVLSSLPYLCHLPPPPPHTHTYTHSCSHMHLYRIFFTPSVPSEEWCYCRWRKILWTVWHSLYYLLSNQPSLCIGCMFPSSLLPDCFLLLLFLCYSSANLRSTCYIKAIALGQREKIWQGPCPHKDWKLWEPVLLSDLPHHPIKVCYLELWGREILMNMELRDLDSNHCSHKTMQKSFSSSKVQVCY